MKDSNNVEILEQKDVSRVEEIAGIVAKLPEQEQDKVFYMLKGLEVLGGKTESTTQTVAATAGSSNDIK